MNALPFGLTPDTMFVAMASSVAFFVVLAVWYALLESNPMERRLRMLTARRTELRGQLMQINRRPSRRADGMTLMRQLVGRMRLLGSEQAAKLHDKLAQAGLRSRDSIVLFMFFKLAMPVALGGLAFLWVYLLQVGELAQGPRLLVLGGAALLGFFAPEIYLSNAITKRQKALQKALPDGLDLLVICAESGLALDAALERVAGETGAASPELAEELSLTSVELGFLPDRRQALHNLNRRTNLPAIRGVVNTLVQTEKYGTPLSQSLRVLAHEFRDQRMMRAEEKAARLPAVLTVPMIVFILPTLFIVLMGPAILSIMDNLMG
ncbi:MAG TPA: type II secretion system F family protein [Geminicoccaceae bacterium]